MKAPCPPRNRFERWTWHLRNPLVVVLLLALVGMSCYYADSWDRGSLGPFRKRQVRYPTYTEQVFVLRRGDGGYEVLDPQFMSWDRLSRLTQENAYDLLDVQYVQVDEVFGRWYPTWYESRRWIVMDPLGLKAGKEWSDAELARVRELFLGRLAVTMPEQAASVRNGNALVREVRWDGVALNGLSLVVGLLLPFLAYGSPPYVRLAVARRRLARGECGCCRYELQGMVGADGRVRCPECGAVWGAEGGGLRVLASA
ncbi:MAG TPA: hypothetical protein VD997_02405 [Phycisphaerales bacterium]|nr:hypothetical protein [Phycisphaerales bacterium]